MWRPKNDIKSLTVYKEETIYNMQAIEGNMKIPFGYFSKLFFSVPLDSLRDESPFLSERSGPWKWGSLCLEGFSFFFFFCLIVCFFGISRGGDQWQTGAPCFSASFRVSEFTPQKWIASEPPSWNPAL